MLELDQLLVTCSLQQTGAHPELSCPVTWSHTMARCSLNLFNPPIISIPFLPMDCFVPFSVDRDLKVPLRYPEG